MIFTNKHIILPIADSPQRRDHESIDGTIFDVVDGVPMSVSKSSLLRSSDPNPRGHLDFRAIVCLHTPHENAVVLMKVPGLEIHCSNPTNDLESPALIRSQKLMHDVLSECRNNTSSVHP